MLLKGSPDDAIGAAVEIMRELHQFNEEHKSQYGFDKIDMGVGIHTGTLMLGTIGEQGRMDVTVISDAVNLASRLESLTKAFGTSILVSNSSLENVSKFRQRHLGKVKVKGKNQSILLYEICEGLPEEIIVEKLSAAPELQKGLNLYNQKKFREAKEIFEKLFTQYPRDKVLNIYRTSCENFMKYAPEYFEKSSEPWSGALSLSKVILKILCTSYSNLFQDGTLDQAI